MQVRAETVFFYLYDAGRSIDLAKVAKLIPAIPDAAIIKNRRDTPESLTLPVPLTVQLANVEFPGREPFERAVMYARIFEEGVISMVVRVSGDFSPEDLHKIRTLPVMVEGKLTDIDAWTDESLKALFARIQEAISFEQYVFSTFVRETYTAFCITTPIADPRAYIEEHRKTIACLLNGESLDTDLDESQIAATLCGSFCYTNHDLALFDLHRCIIIDPNQDYEDIMLVIEQAIFQILELRALDKLLDRWLDKAEDDIKIVFRKNAAHLKTLKVKLASIQALNFDALFILENLENSSKIIGSYFLGQIYANLCGQFNTEGWKRSIERRLTTLDSVYRQVAQHETEQRMLFLEVMFIIVCVIFPAIQILQVFFVSG